MPNSVADELAAKTFHELEQADKPHQRSRISNTPNGYIFLIPWANASLLRILIRTFTDALPKNELRLKKQLDDAARSIVANIEEGFARPSTHEYITFLGFSQGSLKEVKGDVQRSLQDGFLVSKPGSSLTGIGIDLKAWHEALKRSVVSRKPENKGVYRNLEEENKNEASFQPYKKLEERGQTAKLPLNSFRFLYSPVDELNAQALTYEHFIELINKTDWHLRRLVESLENKLNRDQKFYQVEQARIRSKLKLK